MKRNKFLLAAASLLAIPREVFSRIPNLLSRTNKGFKISAGEGRIHGHMALKGINANVLDLKVSGTDTDGGIAMFEQKSRTPKRGTPLHVHPLQDEIFFVQEGSYRFLVGEDKFSLEK